MSGILRFSSHCGSNSKRRANCVEALSTQTRLARAAIIAAPGGAVPRWRYWIERDPIVTDGQPSSPPTTPELFESHARNLQVGNDIVLARPSPKVISLHGGA